MASTLACTVTENGSAAVWLHLVGVLDLVTCSKFEQALRHAEPGARLIVLDLRKLTSATASGVRVIVDAINRARRDGCKLVVTRASNQVESLLALIGGTEVPARIALPPFWGRFEPRS